MGMPFSPGNLLGVHIRGFALISGGMTLSDDRLMTPPVLLAMPHPFDIERLPFGMACRREVHGSPRRCSVISFCSGRY